LCITKLDVLDGLETIKMCASYDYQGESLHMPPLGADAIEQCVAVYESMPGWSESTVGVKNLDDLPENARNYLKRLEEMVGVPVDIVSTGPERDETIVLNHPFD
jgi:adenylosuccinate synthase